MTCLPLLFDVYNKKTLGLHIFKQIRLIFMTSLVFIEGSYTWLLTLNHWYDLGYCKILISSRNTGTSHISNFLSQDKSSSRPGVSKHFPRRATLKTFLLPRAAYLTFTYFCYNLRFKLWINDNIIITLYCFISHWHCSTHRRNKLSRILI